MSETIPDYGPNSVNNIPLLPELQGELPSFGTNAQQLESLRDTPPTWNMWNSTPTLFGDTEVTVVRADTLEIPSYKVFASLSPERWVEMYEHYGSMPGVIDGKYYWQQKKSSRPAFHTGDGPRTRSRYATGGKVNLLYSDYALSYDGLVEIEVPISSDAQADACVINTLLGEAIGNPSKTKSSEERIRNYLNLPIGPVTQDDIKLIESHIRMEQVSPHHIAPIVEGIHELIRDANTNRNLIVRHRVSKPEDAVEIIANGGIASKLQRLMRGAGNINGRSSHADLAIGGADSVFGSFTTIIKEELPKGSVAFLTKPGILDRLDIRAYDNDAYGSRERQIQDPLDITLKRRVKRKAYTPMYEDREQPRNFDKMSGLSEVCVGTEIGINECGSLVVGPQDESSFHDFRWEQILHSERQLKIYGRSLLLEIQDNIRATWGNPERVKEIFSAQVPDLPQEQIDYITTGMNLPLRDRMIARLKKARYLLR